VYNISLNTEFLIYKIFKNLQLFDIDLQQKWIIVEMLHNT
jgi:hypothetical protein